MTIKNKQSIKRSFLFSRLRPNVYIEMCIYIYIYNVAQKNISYNLEFQQQYHFKRNVRVVYLSRFLGTYDAISLDPDDAGDKRIVYVQNVGRLLMDNGLLLLTSCNWTADELVHHINEGAFWRLHSS